MPDQTLANRLIDPQDPRLRELYRRSSWRSIRAFARCWFWIAAALALAALRPGFASYAIAFIAIGTQQYALTILSHEGKHRNLFGSQRINDFCALWLASAPLGTDFFFERRVHLDHHAKLGEYDDPDRDLYGVENKTNREELLAYLSGMTTIPGVRKRPGTGRKRLAALVIERRHAIPAQLLIFAVFAVALRWWLYLPLWIVPLFVLMLIPQRIRQFCEHAQPRLSDDAFNDRRLVSYRPTTLERLFLAPFNMGYHAEHHLWPSVPWFQLPRLAQLVPEGGIERRRGYIDFLRRYVELLPLMKEARAA